ncbi:T-complex protein 11-like protein 1 [Protopterus annectens]|uniref:T-complex protein 11-like protein 1 n=1 Tax=Protopterus annectens TaxID=7888 RepID=UPI001CFAD72E|nr:T-complex protein 11-like protein 1 [Protopterus annectens]
MSEDHKGHKKSHSDEGKTSDSHARTREDVSDSVEESLNKRIRHDTPSPHHGSTPPSSPPKFVSVEELMETAKGVTKMALAHEIVVNGGFQIKPPELPEGSLEKRVRDIMRKAFWDCLEAQLNENPPEYDHAVKLLEEIKETLLSFLLPGHTRLRNQINEVLDLDLIKQEANNGVLDISKLARFIIGIMGTLCAPARDEEVKKLGVITGIVPLLREIFKVLDLMKMDMVNFAVSSIRPHLMQQSVEYERKNFQEFLDKQPNALDFTTEWLQEAISSLSSSETATCQSVPHATASADSVRILNPVTVQNQAYLRLLKWDHITRPFPETLLMDQSRFVEIKTELDQLTIVAAVLLVSYNVVGTALSGLPGFMDRLKKNIRVLLPAIYSPSFSLSEALAAISEKISVDISSCLSEHGFATLTKEKEAVLKGQIQSIEKTDNAVRSLIDSRIQIFLQDYLTSGHQKSVPVIPGGLVPIQKELEEIAVKYIRLVNYNKMVFGPYYSNILSKLLNKDESDVVNCPEQSV